MEKGLADMAGYEDAGGHPINHEGQIEEATRKVESHLESMAETIRDLLEALESVKNEQELIYGGYKTTAWQVADKAIKKARND